jgi:hypothetical protein
MSNKLNRQTQDAIKQLTRSYVQEKHPKVYERIRKQAAQLVQAEQLAHESATE